MDTRKSISDSKKELHELLLSLKDELETLHGITNTVKQNKKSDGK